MSIAHHSAGGEVQGALDEGRTGRRADAVLRGGRTQQLPQAGHQHRLPRTTLPRHHVQAGRQLNRLLRNQRVVPAEPLAGVSWPAGSCRAEP